MYVVFLETLVLLGGGANDILALELFTLFWPNSISGNSISHKVVNFEDWNFVMVACIHWLFLK